MTQVTRATFQTITRQGILFLGRAIPKLAANGADLPQHFVNAGYQIQSLLDARQLCIKQTGIHLQFMAPMMDLVNPLKNLGGVIRYPADNAPEICESPVLRMQSEFDMNLFPTAAKVNELLQMPDPGINLDDLRTLPVSLQVTRQIAAITANSPDPDGITPFIAGVETGPFSGAGRLFSESLFFSFFAAYPEKCGDLMQKLTNQLIARSVAHIRAGAQGVVLCEPTAGLIGPRITDWQNPYVRQIFNAIADEGGIPIYHNCADAMDLPVLINALLHPKTGIFSDKTRPDQRLISIGNGSPQKKVNLRQVADLIGDRAWVCGNLDPDLFTEDQPRAEMAPQMLSNLLQSMKGVSNFIPASGCDLKFNTIPERALDFFRIILAWYSDPSI